MMSEAAEDEETAARRLSVERGGITLPALRVVAILLYH